MIVQRVSKGYLKDRVKLIAPRNETVTFQTFLGYKIFWVEQGDIITMKIPKSWMVEKDDSLRLEDLVYYNQDPFCWHWG